MRAGGKRMDGRADVQSMAGRQMQQNFHRPGTFWWYRGAAIGSSPSRDPPALSIAQGAAQKILDNRAGVPPTPPSRRRTLLCAPARTYIYLLAAVSAPDSRLRPFSTRILSVTTGRRSSTSPWRRSRSASRQAATARCLSRSPIRTAPPQRCRTSPSSPKPPPSTS